MKTLRAVNLKKYRSIIYYPTVINISMPFAIKYITVTKTKKMNIINKKIHCIKMGEPKFYSPVSMHKQTDSKEIYH